MCSKLILKFVAGVACKMGRRHCHTVLFLKNEINKVTQTIYGNDPAISRNSCHENIPRIKQLSKYLAFKNCR